MIWPDESSFEGYWVNNVPVGVGIFRASGLPYETAYEGFWAKDRQTQLSVFRQNVSTTIEADLDLIEKSSDLTSLQERQNGLGIEVWSDGSYYHGNFNMGVKEGDGCYFWADGSKYTGYWLADEMSGQGCFQWADGRYF